MNVKERLKKYVESQKMTIVEFEKTLEVSNGYVNSISKSIGIDKICILLEKYPNINLEWLFTGNGNMNKNSEHKEPELKEEIKFVDNNYLLDRVEKLAIENNELKKELAKIKNNPKSRVNPKPYKQGEEQLMVAEPNNE